MNEQERTVLLEALEALGRPVGYRAIEVIQELEAELEQLHPYREMADQIRKALEAAKRGEGRHITN